MSTTALVVINEDHTIMEQQKEILFEAGVTKIVRVDTPKQGFNKEQTEDFATKLNNASTEDVIVIASPLAYLFKLMKRDYKVFFNSKRDKLELSGGKTIYTVAKEGWELL